MGRLDLQATFIHYGNVGIIPTSQRKLVFQLRYRCCDNKSRSVQWVK